VGVKERGHEAEGEIHGGGRSAGAPFDICGGKPRNMRLAETSKLNEKYLVRNAGKRKRGEENSVALICKKQGGTNQGGEPKSEPADKERSGCRQKGEKGEN